MDLNLARRLRTPPDTLFPEEPETLHEYRNWRGIPLRSEWRDVSGKPEETVRQHFIRHLHDTCGYALDQTCRMKLRLWRRGF